MQSSAQFEDLVPGLYLLHLVIIPDWHKRYFTRALHQKGRSRYQKKSNVSWPPWAGHSATGTTKILFLQDFLSYFAISRDSSQIPKYWYLCKQNKLQCKLLKFAYVCFRINKQHFCFEPSISSTTKKTHLSSKYHSNQDSTCSMKPVTL